MKNTECGTCLMRICSSGDGSAVRGLFSRRLPAVLALAVSALETVSAGTADHLLNPRRTGYTSHALPPPYRRVWEYRAPHKPRQAWPEPVWEVQRIDFDYAYALSAANGLVYYASSSEHAVYALDLATGAPRWRFITGGPVRLAPEVYAGRVFFSSDDGWVYCVEGKTGEPVWKHRPDIPDERLVGNEQVISRWPARSGVLVTGDRAYTTFGMWSPEGIVVTCLDAKTGKGIWRNDTSGTKFMTQPHYEAMGGVSPQGYLALDGNTLVVACGRAAPAFFDARTGKFLYHQSEGLFPGGDCPMLYAGLTFVPCEYLQKPNPVRPLGREGLISNEAALFAYRTDTHEEVFHLIGGLCGVVTDDGILNLVGPGKLLSVALADVLKAAPNDYKKKMGSSQGHMVPAGKLQRWETPAAHVFSLIQAGNTLIAGRRSAVTCYDATQGEKTWESKVRGDVHELLVVDGALLASTTEGDITCFRPGRGDAPRTVRQPARPIEVSAEVSIEARRWLAAGGLTEGYALLIGGADCALAAELAKQSRFTWYWTRSGSGSQALREQLADAGLYGTRIAIHTVPMGRLPYTDYLANFVLFRVETVTDLERTPAAEVYRVLRPYGGVAVIACPGPLRPKVIQWLRTGGVPADETRTVNGEVVVRRGALPGAGSWTHQYADPGKSGASGEQRVHLPLKVLWFGGLGPGDMVSRHYRGPAPLAVNGRMFVAGNTFLHAVDAYNGRVLWQRKLPGIGRWPMPYRGGSMAADTEGVFAVQGTTCLRLEAATGKPLQVYRPPKEWKDAMEKVPRYSLRPRSKIKVDNKPTWEFLAVTDDTVVGSIGLPNVQPLWWSHAHPANGLVFALDKQTGKPRWLYRPADAVESDAIAIAGNQLFLIDGLAPVDLWPRRGKPGKGRPYYRLPGTPPPRILKALDLHTGKVAWQTAEIGKRQNSLVACDDVVLATVTVWHGLMPLREGPDLSAFSGNDGKRLWTLNRPWAKEPVVVGNTVYLRQSFDLHTGKLGMRPDPLTGVTVPFMVPPGGGCGRISGAPDFLMRRAGSLGFYNLKTGMLSTFPNVRASCWLNMVCANGLVLVPEGSSSCPCAYDYKTSLAFVSDKRYNHWGLFAGVLRRGGEVVRKLRLNLGAPGDKVDAEGNVWYSVPRPSTNGPNGAGGMGKTFKDDPPVEIVGVNNALSTVGRNPDWTHIAGTDKPWLYTFAVTSPLRLRVRLGPDGTPASRYHVRLHFCALDGVPKDGPFRALVQGHELLKSGSVRSLAGGPDRAAVREFTVTAGPILTIEVLPEAGEPGTISGIEVLAGQ